MAGWQPTGSVNIVGRKNVNNPEAKETDGSPKKRRRISKQQ